MLSPQPVRLQPAYRYRVPYFAVSISAGFPSAADDYIEKQLDLNEYLVKRPSATVFFRFAGQSMQQIGIFDGDILIVDRAEEAKHGSVVLAVVEGKFVCRILDIKHHQLLTADDRLPPTPITEDLDMTIEGVVTHSIRHYVRAG